ncbi:DEAD/DEAH box helicase [Eisenbergiella porci]|uniref:DEAD/DEAH box helicase n=1 Tax=Eisenbergiella porci TaxID=2652274 RepID=UPI002A80C64A|nr:DEAD/DEAH box helicase [Eisenbergiella porci]
MSTENKNTPASHGFARYGLSLPILEALDMLGYHHPTAIQQEVIPLVLAGKNVVARSRTGTGKTAAFAVPLCEMAVWEENSPRALVLEPSRELAVQVSRGLFQIGRKKRLKVPAVFGGFPIDKQMQTLKQKSHIVVGTPGRVMDLVRRGSLQLSGITHLVIDEADLMLDMGFLEEVGEIISLLPENRKILLFSATLEKQVQTLIDNYAADAVFVAQDQEDGPPPSIGQAAYEVTAENKYEMFKRVLMKENPDSCMIFCGTREMVNVLFQKLRRDRIFCGMIHGEMEQKERLKNVDAFGRGGFRYLIATDVAARGIDFENIGLVVNYDFPTGKETYVHRIGRTGRNGKDGRAVSLVSAQEKKMLQKVEEYTGTALPVLQELIVTQEEEKAFWALQRRKSAPKAGKGEALNRDIMRLSIGGGRKSKMRTADIVGTICAVDGITAEDIGVIDIRESLTYVEILNRKGPLVLERLQTKPIKGKVRKVRKTSGQAGV